MSRSKPSGSAKGSKLAKAASRVERSQRGHHLAAQERAHDLHWEEGLLVTRRPARSVERETTCRHERVHVRRKAELARPGVQDHRDAEPCAEAQVDFGRMATSSSHGARRRLWAFIVTPSCSRDQFVWPCFTQAVEEVCAGLDAAWAFFGGIVRWIARDNAIADYVGRLRRPPGGWTARPCRAIHAIT